jgi:hypothetical protein
MKLSHNSKRIFNPFKIIFNEPKISNLTGKMKVFGKLNEKEFF